jgi:predicted nucleotidyltransferase
MRVEKHDPNSDADLLAEIQADPERFWRLPRRQIEQVLGRRLTLEESHAIEHAWRRKWKELNNTATFRAGD